MSPQELSERITTQWSIDGTRLTSKDPKSMPNGTFCDDACRRLRRSSIDVSLGSAISSDVANASTTKTFFVGCALPHTFSVTFTYIIPMFGIDFLAVSDSQTVQLSIFTFHELVTTGIVIAGLLVQISYHHWSGTTGAAVDD